MTPPMTQLQAQTTEPAEAPTPARVLYAAMTAVLAICCVLYVVFSRHWPLIGDASMVHYLVLLMQHGMAPYRDIVDAQMPGTYLLDWAVVHTFGGGAVGTRVYDLTLVALAGAALLWIAWPRDRFAGFYAAALLALLHGRDGIPQTAQRDLIIMSLMLLAYAFTFHAVRRGQAAWMLGFGFCAGLAATIKPTAVPLALLLLLAVVVLRRQRRPWIGSAAWGVAGLAIPLGAVLIFLVKERAIPSFLSALRGMWPYYAKLATRPMSYLLPHSVSPLLPLAVLWLLILLVMRVRSWSVPRAFDWERLALWMGLALGLFSYLSQRKGFPYHRYPVLAFVLLLMGLDFGEALVWVGTRPGLRRSLQACGAIGLAAGALFVAPFSAYKISTYDWHQDELFTMIRSDLDGLGGANLSGHVQCLDTFSGCINALDRMKLVESTGFLVDFYFWAPQPSPVTEQMRQRFWTAIHDNPPQVFVEMKQDFPYDTDNFDKVNRWPEFAAYLREHYTLVDDRMAQQWVRRESRLYPPTGYRIYVRKLQGSPQS
jgi:hypothetical protein